jgi:regulatory protein
MKITALTPQQTNDNRVNVMVEEKYRFSLDIYQVIELGVRVGKDYTEEELSELETESQFGKLYGRALEYCMMRPHSAREVRDYLYRKTRPTKKLQKSALSLSVKGSTFYRGEEPRVREMVERPGVSREVAERVFDRLVEKGHINDEQFTRWWVENRSLKKGASRRKLTAELRAKGVHQEIIDKFLAESPRTDETELQKVIAKKAGRYSDPQKLMQYLARQGFSYDDIKDALQDVDAL